MGITRDLPGASGTGSIAPTPTPSTLTTDTHDHVNVNLTKFWFFSTKLGPAPEAARSSLITDVERQTLLGIDRGAQTLGLVGPSQSQITVTLRDTMAASAGPYAMGNKVGVPSTNNVAAAAKTPDAGHPVIGTSELFSYDVALHELAHVVQSQTMAKAGKPALDAATRLDFSRDQLDITGHASTVAANAQEASGLREGLSDATAAVITHDWVIGEGYFAPGSGVRAVRDVANPTAPDTMEAIETDYKLARAGLDGTGPATHTIGGVEIRDNEGHSIGGIVSRATYEYEQSRGWDESTQLVTTLQRDPELWKDNGTLESFRDRFLAAARQIDAVKPGALDAARGALRKVGYTVSDTDSGSPADAPHVPTPVDPGPTAAGPVKPPAGGNMGTVAAHAGVGMLGGAVVGALLGAFTPLSMKAGIIVGTAIGGVLGLGHGVITQ